MERRNEFGQTIRDNPNNPHLGQLNVDGEEATPWGTPQKIAPQAEEQHVAFSGNTRPITSNQGRRLQLVDGSSGQRLEEDQVTQADTLDESVVQEVDRQVQVSVEARQGEQQPEKDDSIEVAA